MPDCGGGSVRPIGFSISHYRPQSASPSPVPFVGFSCALCHSTRIETQDGKTARVVYGPGSVSLNLFAWLDAFQAAVLDREPAGAAGPGEPPYRLTVEAVEAAHREAKGRGLTL